MPLPRVVSLVPSLTETLFALGAGTALVGRSRFCLEPAEVRALPAVGGPKDPDLDAIRRLRPDLVVLGIEENRRIDFERLRDLGIPTLVTHVRAVADVPPLLLELGRRLDRFDAARALAAEVEGALHAVAPFAAEMQDLTRRPLLHTFCPVWRDPWMVASSATYLADILLRVGLPSLLHAPEQPDLPPYRTLTPDEVIDTDPGLVLLPSEPYPFGPDDRDEILAWPVTAARRRAVHLIDGSMVTWYGARTASALHALSLLALEWARAEVDPPPPDPSTRH